MLGIHDEVTGIIKDQHMTDQVKIGKLTDLCLKLRNGPAAKAPEILVFGQVRKVNINAHFYDTESAMDFIKGLKKIGVKPKVV